MPLDAATPGKTARPAGLRRRLAAMLYEILLLTGVLFALLLLPHTLFGMIAGLTAAPWLLLAHFIVIIAAYFVWFWCHGGQTLAMKTWRIRLVDARTGGSVAPSRALLRHLLCWPSLLFFGVGLIWAPIDRDRQFLHDRLAATRLIDAR